MTTTVALGTGLIAGGPVLAVLLLVILRRPHLLVISIIAAFVFSVAHSLSGLVYLIIPPVRDQQAVLLVLSVVLQEGLRLGLFEGFRFMFKSGDGVQAFIRPGERNQLLTGIAVGSGFGFMSIVLNFYYAVVDEFWNDTAIYADVCPVNFFVTASTFALSFSVLHLFLGALVWPAYTDRNWKYIILGFLVHLTVSLVSLNNRKFDGCKVTFGVIPGIVLLFGVASLVVSRLRIGKESS